MAGFLVRRLLNYIALTFIATSLAYFLAAATMNPEANYLGRHPRPTLAAVDATLTRYNLDPNTPVEVRYARWVRSAVHGDLGRTWDGESINADLGRRAVVSLRLLLAGSVLGSLAGVALGAWNAVRRRRFSDRISTFLSFLINSTTVIVIAVLLEQLAIWLNQGAGTNIVNFTGDSTPGLNQDLWHTLLDDLSHQVVPTLALILMTAAVVSRYQRSVMLDVLGADFVRTARAKGLRRRTALTRHALRCALIPSATLFSYTVITLFTGATLMELIFGWHGMGEWAVTSIGENDVNAVAAITAFTSILVLLAGLASDLLVAALDPRVRAGSGGPR
jgi:peptide/nickel transport system permease protein